MVEAAGETSGKHAGCTLDGLALATGLNQNRTEAGPRVPVGVVHVQSWA